MSAGTIETRPEREALRILLVEDNRPDAKLVRAALHSGLHLPFDIAEAATHSEALQAMETRAFDVVLLDLGLPDSRGLATFSLLHARHPRVPVIVLSGLDDEATALDAVRLGAQDYLVKGTWDDRVLSRAVRHAIERQRLLLQLEQALAYARRLQHRGEGEAALPGAAAGMLAMCAWCKRIRDEERRWETVEEFLASRTQTALTHGVCPECRERLQGAVRGGGQN